MIRTERTLPHTRWNRILTFASARMSIESVFECVTFFYLPVLFAVDSVTRFDDNGKSRNCSLLRLSFLIICLCVLMFLRLMSIAFLKDGFL